MFDIVKRECVRAVRESGGPDVFGKHTTVGSERILPLVFL
jgi:hypothetical protein